MAASNWRKKRSVAETLFTQGHRFDFYQAVRLLETIDPVSTTVGDGTDPAVEAVRFRSSLSGTFPASDVDRVSLPEEGQSRFRVDVNFMSLAGAFGPLPPPLAEEVAARARAHDEAGRDFLDIFNHRLVSLMYRARRKHRPELSRGTPADTNFAFYLYSVVGLGTGGLRGRMDVPDRVLLHHAGQIGQQPRSLHGLERLMRDHFGVRIEAEPLQGGWLELDETQVTRLGARLGRNRALGRDTVAGTRVWDQQAGVRLVVGPLEFGRFQDFLPIGRAWAPLLSLFGFYAGTGPDLTVRLRLLPDQVPVSRLKRGAGPRLGWTSWLTTKPRAAEGSVRLRAAPALR